MPIHQVEVRCFTMKMIWASHGINTVDFILWGSWMSVKDFTGIHSIVRRNKEDIKPSFTNMVYEMSPWNKTSIYSILYQAMSKFLLWKRPLLCTLRTRLHGAKRFCFISDHICTSSSNYTTQRTHISFPFLQFELLSKWPNNEVRELQPIKQFTCQRKSTCHAGVISLFASAANKMKTTAFNL